MTHTIGKFHRPTGTVTLAVTHQGRNITRPVKAVIDAEGRHDLKATRARADAVAKGLKHKIERGVILPTT